MKKKLKYCFTEECEYGIECGIYCKRHAEMYEEETGERIKGKSQKGEKKCKDVTCINCDNTMEGLCDNCR